MVIEIWANYKLIGFKIIAFGEISLSGIIFPVQFKFS